KSYVLQNKQGQITETHSIAAGLDYPGVGPELSYLRDSGRAEFAAATDDEAIAALRLLAEVEGIIPALESAHAIAAVGKLARRLARRHIDRQSLRPRRQGHADRRRLSRRQIVKKQQENFTAKNAKDTKWVGASGWPALSDR